MVNAFSDSLFQANAVQLRAEMLVGIGIGILRPQAFALVVIQVQAGRTGSGAAMGAGASTIDDGYCTVEECAAQMGVTVERVVQLVQRGILRSTRDGGCNPPSCRVPPNDP